MKKLFLYIFMVLILNTNAYSIVSEVYLKPIYENCINDAKKNNDYNNESKKFCKCYTNAFNEKFDNQELMNFMMKKDEVKTQFIQNEMLPMCLGKTSTQKSSTKKIKIDFSGYQDAYLDAWDMCLDRGIGTFKNNALLYLDAEKCLDTEDGKLIIEYMPSMSSDLAYKMFVITGDRHSELFALAKKVSRILVLSEYEPSSVHRKIVDDWVDNQYIIYNKYFKKQKVLLRNNNAILY